MMIIEWWLIDLLCCWLSLQAVFQCSWDIKWMCMWERKSRRENGRERHWYTLGRNIYLHVYFREREIDRRKEREVMEEYIYIYLDVSEREGERERMREERQRERDVLFESVSPLNEIPNTLRLTHQRKSEGWFMRSFCVVFVYVWSATSLCRDTQISPLVIIIILSVTGNCRFFWCNTDEENIRNENCVCTDL